MVGPLLRAYGMCLHFAEVKVDDFIAVASNPYIQNDILGVHTVLVSASHEILLMGVKGLLSRKIRTNHCRIDEK